MHGGDLAELWILLIEVQTLRLADVGTTGDRQVHHALLTDFPHGLVDLTEVLWDFLDVLHAAIVGYDLVFDGGRPEAFF